MDISPNRNQHEEIASFQNGAQLKHNKKGLVMLYFVLKTHLCCSPIPDFNSITN